MIRETLGYCDLYKIGLMSGVKKDYYSNEDLWKFIYSLVELHTQRSIKMYIKESIRKRIDNDPIISKISVISDYNIFTGA